jgi:hypothetical protein
VEPPRPTLQEDGLIVELPLAGPVSKEWQACFTALARADDVPAEVKDSAKNANFAELYYRLAKQITAAGAVPFDNLSADFFGQVGVASSTSPADAAIALQAAGDRMLQAIVFHSDHLELSEQFDATTGYEKSVRNLSWSYASFLSAIRAKTALT